MRVGDLAKASAVSLADNALYSGLLRGSVTVWCEAKVCFNATVENSNSPMHIRN